MTGEGPKSRIRRSRVNLSPSSEEPLDAVASTGAEPPRSHTEQSPASGDLAPVQSRKRRPVDAASESDPLPAKRARRTSADAQTDTGGARLQARQPSPSSEGPRSAPSAPVHEPQAGTESIPSPSKRAGLPRTNTQQSGVKHKEVEGSAKTVQQPNHLKRPYTSAFKPDAEEQEQVSPATRSQKRQIGSYGGDNECRLKRARLTRKNLALFDKMGKKKVTDSTDESGSTKTTSTTTSGFAIKARKNGILLPPSSKAPTNHKTRCERGARSRGTASPTESEHGRFVDRIRKADNEMTMVIETSKLLKEYDGEGYKRAFNQQFTGFPKNVGFNNGLSAPQPDFVEGLEAENYLPFPIDEQVSGAVLYKDNPYSVTLPHVAGEWKGPEGNMKEAELQSSYDGAAMVYARNQALAYVGRSDPPGHAVTTTFTTDGANLHFYSHYAAQTEDKTLEYHQYPEASYNLMESNGYKNGRRHLRNAQDDAKDQSCDLRDQLRERYKQQRSTLPSIAQGTPIPTPVLEPTNAYKETTQYGDEAGYEIIKQPCQPTPAASMEPHKAPHSHSSRSSHSSSNDSHKRKPSSSQTSSQGSPGHASKHRNYWKRDPKTGNYYHRHSDGTVSWLDDDDGGH